MTEMVTNCQRCGAEIPASATFCPKCWFQNSKTNSKYNLNQFNISWSSVLHGLVTDSTNVKVIQAYAKRMGFLPEDDNFMYGFEYRPKRHSKLLNWFNKLKIRHLHFIISFMPTGLLFMGLTYTVKDNYDYYQFNHRNSFIPKSQIKSLTVKDEHVYYRTLYIKTAHSSFKFLIPKLWTHRNYQAPASKRLPNLVNNMEN